MTKVNSYRGDKSAKLHILKKFIITGAGNIMNLSHYCKPNFIALRKDPSGFSKKRKKRKDPSSQFTRVLG